MKSIDDDRLDEEYPLADALDNDIVMHRDVHFGGSFDVMLDYYKKGGKGIVPAFEVSRILELQAYEANLKQNLAGVLLSGADAEKIGKAKDAYKKLRDLYEIKRDATTQYPKLVADLILSESDDPQEEISAIVSEKSAIVPALLSLMKSEEFYDPLFPGYGLAPGLAAQCLGQIGDKRAISTLFESIGESDFNFEDTAVKALRTIGQPAKEFLFRVLHGRPITYDNERAAVALLQFKDDTEVPVKCFEILKELNLQQQPVLATYLILICEGLNEPKLRQEFIELSKREKTPKMLKQDFNTILEHWKVIGA